MPLIEINNPRQVNSARVFNQVKELAEIGIRSRDINLLLHFFCPNDVLNTILNDFRKLKNKVYFELDNK